MMNFKKFTAIVSGIVLTFLFLIGFVMTNQLLSAGPDEKDGTFVQLIKRLKPQEEVVNLLLMGTDKGGHLTDTIVVVNYNLSTGKVSVLSIPRDTKVVVDNYEMKINAVYGYGKQQMIVDTVSQLLNTPITHYAILNLEAFKKTVDLLDGVEMDIPENMDYEDPFQDLKIHLKKGRTVLNGNEAEQYMRYRSGYAEGDIGRVKAQKLFFEALLKQKLKPKYITKVDDIIKTVMDNMVTSIKPNDIPRLAKGLGKIKPDEIQYFILPGQAMNGSPYYYLCDKAATAELVNAYFRTDVSRTAKKQLPQLNQLPEKLEPFTPPTLNVKPSEAPVQPTATPEPYKAPTPVPENPSLPVLPSVPTPLPSHSPAG